MSNPRTHEAICADLDALTQERGFIYSLVTILRHDLFLNPAEAVDINWRERLSFQELTFLSGLLVKRRLDLTQTTTEAIKSQIEHTYALFSELHHEHGARWLDRLAAITRDDPPTPENFREKTADLFGAGDVMAEPIFYSSSGAFDFQYWEFAPKRYGLDADWLMQRKGLDITTAGFLVRTIKDLKDPSQGAVSSDLAELGEQLLDLFCVREEDFPGLARDEVDAFFAAFSLEPGAVNEGLTRPGQYNQLSSHPLIRLEDGRYFLPVYFNLAQSLYESPFFWMLEDESYRDQSLQHRGDGTENLVQELLVGVFGEADVYRSVKILRGRDVLAEIDVLAILGGKALVVQCKSKRLTELARLGDTETLKKDFKLAVQDAYDQGLRCRELLLSQSGLRFEVDEGALDLPEIGDAFVLCALSDHYPSLTHQVHVYLDRRPDDPTPVALSVFDLDVLCFYLRNPFDLLYYVRQRIALAERVRSDEEIALLAYHLHNKLYQGAGPDFIAVDSSMAQLIDANFPAAKGFVPQTPAADRLHHGWKNAEFDELMQDVQSGVDPKRVDAAFFLMDMAGDFADQLTGLIAKTKGRSASDGEKHSVVMVSDEADAGVTFVSRGVRPERLGDDVALYAQAKKYATRKTTWLGLGAMARSRKAAEVVLFDDEPWSENEELELLARTTMRPGIRVNPRPKIGRNEPCYCGSGLKYKRCHGKV
jgi:hypothetical protein